MKNRELERLLDRARCEIETLDFEDCITLIEKDEIPMEMFTMLMNRMEWNHSMKTDSLSTQEISRRYKMKWVIRKIFRNSDRYSSKNISRKLGYQI